ncbi:MAG: glycerophosphodiester phosphodiesterase family protein [Legionella sp.]|nr:glycerophosphodiester phosphodiesterase family protein [Legionella sp.]
MGLLDFIDKSINACFACLPRKAPDKNRMEAVQLIAHRGAHSKKHNAIENTHAAFEHAHKLGCWGIELDVQVTADDVLVVNHDPDLKRLWNHDVAINTISFKQLREYAPLVPTLAEVVERYSQRMHLFIELKAPFTAEVALLSTLGSLTPCVDYHLLSLEEPLLASLTVFPRQSLLLVAGHNNTAHFCNLSLQNQYGGVLGHYLLLNKTHLTKLRRAEQKAGVGFIASKFSLYREVERGITWVFSDNAIQVSAYLNRDEHPDR